jgi:hypothetical protein
MIMLACTLTYQRVNAQSDIAVQLLTSGTTYVYERYYEYDGVTGDPNIDIDVPCEIVRDKERQTGLIYGMIRFPDGDGSGDLAIRLVPSRGMDWSGILLSTTGDVNGIPLISIYALSIYPRCKLRLEWTNPGTTKWKLVLFTRAFVN